MKNKIYICVFVGIIAISISYYFGVYIPKKEARIVEQQKQAEQAIVTKPAATEETLSATENEKHGDTEELARKIVAAIAEENKQNLENVQEMTEEDIYQNPFVMHIRVALNGYLYGSMKEEDLETSESEGEMKCGLANFDKLYYKSKFVVLQVEPNKYGGMNSYITFVDKPDAVFWAWVYEYGESGQYVLRGLCEKGYENKAESIKELKKILARPGQFNYSL